MDGLQFMYFALGGGFIALVVFMCIALFHFIRILSDVADASDSVKETAEKVNETVAEVADKVVEVADQVSTYVVKPVSMMHFFMERVKPFIDMVQKKTGAVTEDEEDESDDEEEETPKKTKKRRTFGKKRK
jgi:TRAP-type C4-dicarboxylate transport system permease small subunit